MKYRHVLDRRTMLKAGGIAIGLPFLDCMLEKSAFGAPTDPPASIVTLMNGLGTPRILVARGNTGPLGAYKPLIDANKLSLYTNTSIEAAGGGANGQHHYGQPYLFAGYPTTIAGGLNAIPGGPTLHYVVMKQQYPAGVPTPFKIIDVGIGFRRGKNWMYKRIWNDQKQNAADFEDLASPLDMFDKIFGTMMTATPMMQADPKARAAKSILDCLIPAYQKFTGAGSNLPAGDIVILQNHLDRIRQLEQQVYGMPTLAGKVAPPMRPNPPNLKYMVNGGACGDVANWYVVSPADFSTAYQIMADLLIAGLEMDYFRFGNLCFDYPGGQTMFTGPLPSPDDANYMIKANPHANYHAWNPADANIVKIATQHNFFVHKNIAQVLTKMGSTNFLGPNGKTLLDNALIMLGSEVGTNHDLTSTIHGFAGGNGKLKMGVNSDAPMLATEMYNAIGKTLYGLPKVGDITIGYKSDATSILA
jgi:Protein of unknown function (DUF1552)